MTTAGILRFALDRPVQGFAQNDTVRVLFRSRKGRLLRQVRRGNQGGVPVWA